MRAIEVLGPGLQQLQAAGGDRSRGRRRSGMDAEIRHVVDYGEVSSRGVLSTPGLVIDSVVVSVGRVPTSDHVEAWLGVPDRLSRRPSDPHGR